MKLGFHAEFQVYLCGLQNSNFVMCVFSIYGMAYRQSNMQRKLSKMNWTEKVLQLLHLTHTETDLPTLDEFFEYHFRDQDASLVTF